MKEVEHRVFLAAGLISVRSIDGDAAVYAQYLAVIPAVCNGSALISLKIVLGTLTRNHEHVEIACTVTLYHIVLGIVYRNAVHNKVVGVNLGRWGVNCYLPNAVLSFTHGYATVLHPVALEINLGSVVGIKTESDLVTVDFG